jgi:DNA-binding PadR family transcriptional regulator
MKGLPTDLEMLILAMLISGREMYGMQMVDKAADKLGESSVYVVLTRMIARGYLSSRHETDEEKQGRGPKRRLYKVTGYGQQMYEARLAADRAVERAIAKGGFEKPEGAL